MGHVKIALDVIAAIFSLQYRYNDHIWQAQPVATLLHALKGQTLAPFNLGWRLPFRIFRIERRIKTVNESNSTWLTYVCLPWVTWVITASAAILVQSLYNHLWQSLYARARRDGPVFRHDPRYWCFVHCYSVTVTLVRLTLVSLKPDRKIADKTAKINSDGRASRIQRDRTRRVLLEFYKTAHRGGTPIGAGGVMTPHFSRQRGTGGHNLGIIH